MRKLPCIVCNLHCFLVGDVDDGTRPKDTFDESAQEKSPCEDNVNGGLVDAHVEGRTGVQVERVESEVVLICDGYNREGAYDNAMLGCEDEVFQ